MSKSKSSLAYAIFSRKQAIAFVIFWTVVHTAVYFYMYFSALFAPNLSNIRETLSFTGFLARSAAVCLNIDSAVILIPLCRNLLTKLRSTFLRKIINFDRNITFHRIAAYSIVFFSMVHIIAHNFNFLRVQNLMGGNVTTSLVLSYSTYAGSTGYIILLFFFLMYTSAMQFMRRKNFEMFWYTHHLFVLYFPLLVMHGAGCFLKTDDGKCLSFQSYKYITMGCVLYAAERFIRVLRAQSPVEIVKIVAHPSKTIEIQFRKAGITTHAGQYVFLNSPELAKFEWHPFTLTSAPEEDYMSVHINIVGDWTRALAARLGVPEGVPKALPPMEVEDGLNRYGDKPAMAIQSLPKLYVDGGFGSASEDVFQYEVAILVGAGIGVTPFASILKSVWYRLVHRRSDTKLRKLHFYWICRDKQSFEWFQALLEAMEEEDANSHYLELNVYLTGALKENELKNVIVNSDDVADPITNLKTRTQYGRPNFGHIFSQLKNRYCGEREAQGRPGKQEFGVFFCGPKPVSATLSRASWEQSDERASFYFQKENF